MALCMEPTTRNETVVPLIRVCRKLEMCNTNQLSAFLQELPRVFEQYVEQEFLNQTLRRIFCTNHSSFSPELFDALLEALPDENALSVDDSIAVSRPIVHQDDTSASSPSASLLNLPKDIKIATFNYLPGKDLFSIQKVCRCLAVAARDPNSLYSFSMPPVEASHCWHHWFSKLKHLKMQGGRHGNFPLFPAFYRSLTRFELSTRTECFIQKPFENLRELSLQNNKLDTNWMQTLVQCRDLQNVHFFEVKVDPELAGSFPFPKDCFQHLTNIQMSVGIIVMFPRLIAAMLSTGSGKRFDTNAWFCRAQFKDFQATLFNNGSKHLLMNIGALDLGCGDNVFSKSLISNIASAIKTMHPSPCFESVQFGSDWDFVQQQTVLVNLNTILGRSKRSKLCLMSEEESLNFLFDRLIHPYTKIISFDELFLEFGCTVYDVTNDNVHNIRTLYNTLLATYHNIPSETWASVAATMARQEILKKHDTWFNWLSLEDSILCEKMKETNLKHFQIEWTLHFPSREVLKEDVGISSQYAEYAIERVTTRLIKAVSKFFTQQFQHLQCKASTFANGDGGSMTINLKKSCH